MKDEQEKCLGAITLDGTPLVVSDPCYLKAGGVDSGLAGTVEVDLPAGTYPVWATISDEGEFGERVSELRLELVPGGGPRLRQVGEAGVDSGQMSMLPFSALSAWLGDDREGGPFPADFTGYCAEQHEAGKFNYGAGCHLTLNGFGGVLRGLMAVCSSGFGDGSYPVFVQELSDGRVAAVSVSFIDDEDDEEAEDEA